MTDTPPEIAKMVREMLMARSGFERVMMGVRASQAAREIVLSSFPPELSEIEIKRRLCERFYGREVDVDAFIESLLRKRDREIRENSETRELD